MDDKQKIFNLEREIEYLKKELKKEQFNYKCFSYCTAFFIAALYAFFVGLPEIREYSSIIEQMVLSLVAGFVSMGLIFIMSSVQLVLDSEKNYL